MGEAYNEDIYLAEEVEAVMIIGNDSVVLLRIIEALVTVKDLKIQVQLPKALWKACKNHEKNEQL